MVLTFSCCCSVLSVIIESGKIVFFYDFGDPLSTLFGQYTSISESCLKARIP